jgi:hypothetical protein
MQRPFIRYVIKRRYIGHTKPGRGIEMNVVNQAAMPQRVKGDSLQRVAQWLKCNGGIRVQPCARQQMAARYPEGLLSHAELDALAGVLRS